MTKTVWKFSLPIGNVVSIPLPKGAEILHVDSQANIPTLWALVDPDARMEPRSFRFAGTGHPIKEPASPTERLKHIGSFLMHGGALVFHLFEYIELEG